MKLLLVWLQELLIVVFLARVLWFWRKLYINYKYLRTKYPVSIWKLPSRNLHLLNEEDKTQTKRLYIRYALHLFIGMIIIILFSALVLNIR